MVSKNSLGKKILTYLVIVIALAAFIFPIYWMFIASFKENSILMRVPPQLYPTFKTIDNYISIITNTKYLNYIKNSFVVASLTVIVDLALAIFAGYSLSRYRYPGRKTIMTLTLSAQVFPTVVIIISLYSLFSKLKLMNSYQGLMLADVAMSLPLSVWMMKSFFDTIPVSLDEAAKIDGCGRFQTLVDVILPMMKPGIYAVGIYSFLMAWDDFVFSKVLINVNDKKTLTVGIAESFLGEFSHNYAGMMALAVVAALPIVIIFIVFQKFLISGMTAGAVKE